MKQSFQRLDIWMTVLNIDIEYFEQMVDIPYPKELQLNKTNASDTETLFLDLHLSISNDMISNKIYDKRNEFDFDIVISIFGWRRSTC